MDYEYFYNNSYTNTNLNTNRSYERMMSNRAKSYVIDNIMSRYVGDTTYVLDLCGGKGQDIFKWAKLYKNVGVDIYYDLIRYINLDISKDGIDECLKRIQGANLHSRYKAYQYDVLSNLLDENLPQHIINRPSIVSCQLAFHYAFESCDKYETALANVLVSNPVVIFLTYPDPSIISSSINSFSSKDSKNIIAKIEDLHLDKSKPFGNSYRYYQHDTCVSDYITEFVVDEDKLFNDLCNMGYTTVFDMNHGNIVGVDVISPVSLYKSVVFALY